ncbi:hypothetical protein MTR67_027546 [Solanum verrucosum]|uniref:Reverse transcriptase zinc-binding domain-containing protein n=1 Tax=Solanum verrucosum TaxID=315347 RepID=A0AAF0TVH1_SOLVR|nr:hypothetical protein MTR67_027546 [Solanum verrucosum]
MAVVRHWPPYQLDIKNVFLHGDPEDEVYMEQPPGFVAQGESSNMVCRLRRAFYDLKQSPRAWFGKFSMVIQEFGMVRSEADHSMFYCHSALGLCMYLVVYVDDIVITGNDDEGITKLKHHIFQHFQTKDLGRLRYFLGIEVAQSKSGIVISQRKYALDMILISAKHGIQSHWCTSLSRAPYGVGVWKHIGKLWEEFSQHKHFTVGNGLHIRFWKDKWLCNTVLMDDYPGLFYLARDPDSTISQNRDGTTWSIMFRRNMQDWEFNELIKLLQTLQSFSLNTQATDQFKWGTTGAGNYTVSAAYKQSRALNAVTDHWPWKLIWKIKLPPKIICFCWTALYEACLTQDNLYKRKHVIVNGCYLCQKAAESNRHFFLHCTVTANLWNMFYSLFGLSWVMPHSIKEAYESWYCWKVDSTIKETWKMIPAAIFWSIWREKNRRCLKVYQLLYILSKWKALCVCTVESICPL